MVNNLQWYFENRKEQYDCANECFKHFLNGKDVNLNAYVKSGKKDIIICSSLIARQKYKECSSHMKNFFYITSLNRLDTKEQFEELESYNINCFILTQKQSMLEFEKQLNSSLLENKNDNSIVIYFDESDCGTGDKQKFQNVYDKYIKPKDNDPKIVVCFISATNDEKLVSGDNGNCENVTFVPHKNYRGSKWFLENNLVFEALPFFDKKYNDLTSHGISLLREYVLSDKEISVIRVLGSGREQSKLNLAKNAIDSKFPNTFIIKDVSADKPFYFGKNTDGGDGELNYKDLLDRSKRSNKKNNYINRPSLF
jgi:hypothetical protein